MKVTLNIQEDAELRNAIKEAIKGQVKSLVHDDLRKIAKDALEKKLSKAGNGLDYIIGQAVQREVSDILHKNHNVNGWSNEFLKPFINERLNQVLASKDWNRLVDELAREKVRSLIK